MKISQPGWYRVGFALGEIAEGPVPSVLALDNMQLNLAPIPEAPTFALFLAGLLPVLWGKAKRRHSAGTRT